MPKFNLFTQVPNFRQGSISRIKYLLLDYLEKTSDLGTQIILLLSAWNFREIIHTVIDGLCWK